MPVLAVKIETSQSAQVSRTHHNGWILRIELPGNDSLTAEGERDKALPNERHARFYPTRSGNDNPAQSVEGSPRPPWRPAGAETMRHSEQRCWMLHLVKELRLMNLGAWESNRTARDVLEVQFATHPFSTERLSFGTSLE